MSVPEGQRGDGKLKAIVKAMELASYTLAITKNKNVFPLEYQSALTDDIIRTSKDIYLKAFTANNILVKNGEDWKKRCDFQKAACNDCNNMLALIQLAQPVFHLKSKRIKYWGEKVLEVRNLLRKWNIADSKRYNSLL